LRWAHTEIGKKRAGRLVVAVQTLRNQNQKYPENLGEIAPQFIRSVPRSNYPLANSNFHYAATPGNHSPAYVDLPALGRPAYNFESGERRYVD